MAERISPAQTLKTLRAGPTVASPPTAQQVAASAKRYPTQFARALHGLLYDMVDAALSRSRPERLSQYASFSHAWRGTLDTDEVRYYFAALDAHQVAAREGLKELDWASRAKAMQVAETLSATAPAAGTIEGLAWSALIGQLQSLYSRDHAARTFTAVREHPQVGLLQDFYRDTGALTYYSEETVKQRRRDVPPLEAMRTWESGALRQNAYAMAVSVDPSFFRIYAPTILHNAQQLPSVDFVIVLCATAQEADNLHQDASSYLAGLTALNRQDAPSNVRIMAVSTPNWVGNERTFYACARFLAVPGLLEDYESVYAMDADLFMVRDPRPFLTNTTTALSVPRTEGPFGVSPWRRYMAGSAVANRDYLVSPARNRLEDYLSVGLAEQASWMLDQNALAYAAEGTPGFRPIKRARPLTVGAFMGHWERNYRKTLEAGLLADG